MRIALAQINTTVGDVERNAQQCVEAVKQATAQGADLVLLPELALCGYPPQDLAERSAFVAANMHALTELAGASRGAATVVGHLAPATDGPGNRVANAASLVQDGRVVARRDKALLPTYDVFDEARYFQPGGAASPVSVAGVQVGVSICEDAWNDPHFWPEPRRYARDPVQELVAGGAELLVNISASPFSAGKQEFRRAMLSATAARHGVPVFAVNLVGGNDQLIFDGRSLALDREGNIIAECAAFEEDLLVLEADAEGQRAAPPSLDAPEEIWRALELGLRDYARKCGFDAAVLALSGGIDSSVTAALAASALGPRNVTALFLPTRFSSEASRRDAEAVASNLDITCHSIPIEQMRTVCEEALAPFFEGTGRGVAEENIQARLRGAVVMAFSNKFGFLPLATGNKSELAVGYCTLYGDMVGGLAVIGDVPKTTVYELARHLNRNGEVIPDSVLTRPPTAELKPDQTDQDVLPPYEQLDPILDLYIEGNCELEEIVGGGHDRETTRRVLAMVDRAEFKRRQAPITLRVTQKAFGPGRRLPVAQNWDRQGSH